MSAQGALSTRLPGRGTPIARLARPRGEWAIVWRQLRRNRSAMIGAAILAVLLVLAIFAPLIAPFDPLDQNPRAAFVAPSSEYFFGTDDTGRDLFSRVIYGTRISLRVGLISVGIGGLTGIVLGVTGAAAGASDHCYPGSGSLQRHDRHRHCQHPDLHPGGPWHDAFPPGA
jgi:peptide/nickel transport system permease protein